MRSVIMMAIGVAAAVGLVICGLWAWQGAPEIANDWGGTRQDVAASAVRCAAIASIALAQAVLIAFVAGRVFARGSLDTLVAAVSAIVVALSSVGAVAFGLASR